MTTVVFVTTLAGTLLVIGYAAYATYRVYLAQKRQREAAEAPPPPKRRLKIRPPVYAIAEALRSRPETFEMLRCPSGDHDFIKDTVTGCKLDLVTRHRFGRTQKTVTGPFHLEPDEQDYLCPFIEAWVQKVLAERRAKRERERAETRRRWAEVYANTPSETST